MRAVDAPVLRRVDPFWVPAKACTTAFAGCGGAYSAVHDNMVRHGVLFVKFCRVDEEWGVFLFFVLEAKPISVRVGRVAWRGIGSAFARRAAHRARVKASSSTGPNDVERRTPPPGGARDACHIACKDSPFG